MSEAAILASASLPLLFLIWHSAEAQGGCRMAVKKETNEGRKIKKKRHENVKGLFCVGAETLS